MKIQFKMLLLFFVMIILAGCQISNPVKRFVYQNKHKTKAKLEIYQTKDEKNSFYLALKNRGGEACLYSDYLDPLFLSGLVETTESGYLWRIEKADFFTNWAYGWTEGSMEASGSFEIYLEDQALRLKLKERVEFWDLKSGQIRYFDSFYLDEKGKNKVRDRVKRSQALSEYLLKMEIPGLFNTYNDFTDDGSFKRKALPILLDKNKKLPEDLAKLRTSGTLLRDIDEAGKLIYAFYQKSAFFKEKLPECIFLAKE